VLDRDDLRHRLLHEVGVGDRGRTIGENIGRDGRVEVSFLVLLLLWELAKS
jgi:hypothetical protein